MRSILAAGIFGALLALVWTSSHSEAPGAVERPQSDLTDFYMFRSYETGRSDFITFLLCFNPLQDTFSGPLYKPMSDAFFYNIHIDNDGDGNEDLTFQLLSSTHIGGEQNSNGFFEGIKVPVGGHMIPIPLGHVGVITSTENSKQNLFQTYRVKRIPGGYKHDEPLEDHPEWFLKDRNHKNKEPRIFAKPYDFAGTKTFNPLNQSYADYANSFIFDVDVPDCKHDGRLFVGQRRDPFAVNLGVIFDLVNAVPVIGAVPVPNSAANSVTLKKAVTVFALELHKNCVRGKDHNNFIGAWGAVNRVVHAEDPVNPRVAKHYPGPQTNRLGNPLYNEVIIGLPSKDYWNRVGPSRDREFSRYARFPSLPFILDSLFNSVLATVLGPHKTFAPTNLPRRDLVAVFLTGIPGLNQHPDTNGYYEYLRLNLNADIQAHNDLTALYALGPNMVGFPNGRRPIDDVVDLALRVAMGLLCKDGNSLFDCKASDAPAGGLPFGDFAVYSKDDFLPVFPYLNHPVSGSAPLCP